MAPLDTGRFIIINSKSRNVVYLADANDSSDIRGDWQQNRPGEMVNYSLLYDNTQTDHLIQWNVVLLSNGNYTIKNYGYSSYATCEYIAKPDEGNNIVGGDHPQQWKIVEEHKDSYVICPTKNGHVYWHLVDGESGTPITLERYSETNKIHWMFSKVEDAEEFGALTPVKPSGSGSPALTPVKPSASGSPLATTDSLVMRSIAPGSRYTIRVVGTNRYLGVPFWSDAVDTCRYVNSDTWLVSRCAGNWRIQVWRSSQYLSIPKYDAGHVSDKPTELSLTPVGGPNEFRISEVDSGRSWGGLVFEYYE